MIQLSAFTDTSRFDMSATRSDSATHSQAFEIKSGAVNLPILKLLSSDADLVAVQLKEKIRQTPDFFRNAPMAIDLHDLADPDADIDFARLTGAMRAVGLIPVGVRGGGERQHQTASAQGLILLTDARHEPAHAPAKPAAPSPPPAESAPNKIVDHPVRSGQRIYAVGGDLVVLAQVSAGAEIMADGDIHVYGTLRGRALAGVQGALHSRIFCLDLQAELIAIGGHYKVSENLDDVAKNVPVQVYLKDNSLIIQKI
jgi:septum site-determining protein MinC